MLYEKEQQNEKGFFVLSRKMEMLTDIRDTVLQNKSLKSRFCHTNMWLKILGRA